MATQVTMAIAFEVHYSILQERGTLARKVHVIRGKSKEDVIDTIKKMLEANGVDLRKANIYKVDEIKPNTPPQGKEIKTIVHDDPHPDAKGKTKQLKDETKQSEDEIKQSNNEADKNNDEAKVETEESGFNNRMMSFVCDVKQNVINNKDGVRTLKLVLEVCGTQVNGVQSGMLKYRPQESLKITCETIQIDMLNDKVKNPEKQVTLDDEIKTRKQEENKELEAKQEKENKSNCKEQSEDKPAEEKVTIPDSAMSHGYDSKGNEYFFDRNTRQFFRVSRDGLVEKVEQPPEPLKAK